ncbi:MAG TPA: PAS domain S-box protein, partial [Nannocystis sp.]
MSAPETDPDEHRSRSELLAELRALRAQVADGVLLQQMRLIFAVAPVLMTYVDADGCYRLVNQQYADWFGRTPEELPGRHMREILGEAAYARARPHVEAALDGRLTRFDIELMHRDGSMRWVSVTYAPHQAPDGEVLGFVGMAMDMTARKRQERELRASREQLEVVLRGVTDAIMMQDHHGRIVYANPVAAATLGIPSVEALLALTSDELHDRFVMLDSDGNLVPPERAPVRRAARGEHVQDHLVRFRTHDSDADRWSAVSSTPVCDELGAVRYVVNIFRDITERRDAERALQAQHQLTRTITDNATSALFLMDTRQHCTFMNPAAEAMLGYTLDEVQGRPLHELIHHHHPDGRPYPISECPIDRALPQRQHERGEDVFIRKDGSFFPVAFTASPIVTDGQPVGTVIEVRDITADLLVQDELRLRARVLQSMSEGVSVADERGYIIFTNAAEDAMFGYAAGELVGQHVSVQNSYPPEENRRIVASVIEHLKLHGAWVGEFHNKKKDGTPFITHSRITTLELSGKRHLLCVQEDITQEKRDREALRFLADASTALVASLDPAETLQSLTRLAVPRLGSWCTVYLHESGGAPHEVVELAALTHIDPDKEAVIRTLHARFPADLVHGQGLGKVLRTGAPQLYAQIDDGMLAQAARDPAELELLLQLAPRSWMMAPLRVQGRTFGAISIVSSTARRYDPGDLALLEEIARRASVAVDNARLFDMAQKERARAEEANRAKDLFLSTLSHELRTPLTAILGWTRMLRSHTLSEEKRAKGLETIDRNARAQVALIEDILDLSRIVTGKLRLDLESVELTAVVEAAVETVRPAADARNIRLLLALDPDAGPVIGDPNRLQQIVWNLLTNAVKFTPRGGQVTVSLRREATHHQMDGMVELVVADDGQGIAPMFLPHVFDRFRQGDASTTRSQGGLGLGLAIVKHLTELHGGTIEAASDGEGLGAAFTVRLPVRTPAPAAEVPAGRDGPELECPPELDGLRVLVVDDEDDAREWIASLLEHCKAVVLTASSAAQALEVLRTERPNIMVSDIGMPG